MTLLDEADLPKLRKVASRQGLVHVAGSCIPPRAATGADTDPRALAINTQSNQFAGSLGRRFHCRQ
jgi:hypothetical protein